MSNRNKRHQPYDLSNPQNWTVGKLKNEIERKGMKLTTNVPKPALLQIYNQLSRLNAHNTTDCDQSVINPTNQTVPNSTSAQVQESVPVSHSELSIPSGAQGGGEIVNNALGVISGVQNAV